jgi:hypothetical protein
MSATWRLTVLLAVELLVRFIELCRIERMLRSATCGVVQRFTRCAVKDCERRIASVGVTDNGGTEGVVTVNIASVPTVFQGMLKRQLGSKAGVRAFDLKKIATRFDVSDKFVAEINVIVKRFAGPVAIVSILRESDSLAGGCASNLGADFARNPCMSQIPFSSGSALMVLKFIRLLFRGLREFMSGGHFFLLVIGDF